MAPLSRTEGRHRRPSNTGTVCWSRRFTRSEEVRKVLDRDRLKPYIRSAEADDLLHGLESVGVVVAELPEIDLSPDPKDNPILAAGLAGRADLIVSGDKRDMLALRHVEGIPIVTPREAAARLHREAHGREEG